MTLPRAARILLLALSLSLPAAGRAEAWAAISGGAYLPGGTSPYGTFQVRPTASLAIGYDTSYVGAAVWAGVVSTSAGLLLQETCFPVMLRVRGRLPLGIVAPFAFAGVGFAPSQALLDMAPYSTVAFTAQAGAGVDFAFADLFTLGVEGSHLWLQPSHPFGTVEMGGTLLLATFGLRFP